MRDLNQTELMNINGGATVPVVSNDSSVQNGYTWGYRVGRAIGQTIEDVGDICDAAGGWLNKIF
jgi:hypothetical protein